MTKYAMHDPEGKDLKFYRGYDSNFIASKARLLLMISETWDDFVKYGQEHQTEFGEDSAKTKMAMRAHVRFAEYHQFEACFSLMLAPFQPLPHWLFLTTYKTAELLDAARAFVGGDVKALTQGRLESVGRFLEVAIYADQKPPDEEAKMKWPENLETIHWMLRSAAERYVKAAAFGGEYNAYKHGLRVLTGTSEFIVSSSPDMADAMTLAQSPDSLTFLELAPHGDGEKQVFEVVRHFNPVESNQYIMLLSALTENMRRCRLALLTLTSTRMVYFHGLDKAAMRGLSNRFEFRMG